MTTITISGTPGSGKSTVAEILYERLDIPYVYSGMLFRNLAEQYNMNLAEFGAYCEQHEHVDRELDEKQIEILRKGNVILEGRLSGWLAYQQKIDAVKIMIIADEKIRAERIVCREGGSVEARMAEMKQREESEGKRYRTYYNIDITDTSIYDIVVDSSDKTPEEIVELLVRIIKNKD